MIEKNRTMNWSQKIYLNDKVLLLTTDINDLTARGANGYTLFPGATASNFRAAMHELEKADVPGTIIADESKDAIDEQLKALFHAIDAAGGIAYNENNEILLIYRRGKWDLPKGKRDDGEVMEECALREVKEETGLRHLQLQEKICDTYHIYHQYGEDVLKRTAWYKMTATLTDKLKPQKEENIVEARWVSEANLAPLVARTYEAVKEVLALAGLKW